MKTHASLTGPMVFLDGCLLPNKQIQRSLSGKAPQTQPKLKRKLSHLACAAAAISFAVGALQLFAQAQPTDVVATVQFSSGQSVTLLNLSDEVGLQPNEAVGVTVQFSADEAGQTISIEPLDGGSIVGGKSSGVVGDDGSLRFRFKAGGPPGHYQVVLRNNAREVGVHFWVFDLANPQNNPPVLTPARS